MKYKKKRIGGKRPGAGRPIGSFGDEKKMRLETQKEMHIRIMQRVNKLLNSQFSLADGLQFLFRIDKDSKGKALPAVIVTDPEEIKRFIDNENDVGEGTDSDSYYYITTQRPDGRALDSLFNRAYGMPTQKLNLGDADGKQLFPPPTDAQRERLKKRI